MQRKHPPRAGGKKESEGWEGKQTQAALLMQIREADVNGSDKSKEALLTGRWGR